MGLQRTVKLILFWLAHLVVTLLVLVTGPVFRWVYEADREKFRVPPADNPLLLKPAVELAALIRKKQVSSCDVVKAFIDRAKSLTPLNAIVADRFDEALEDARKVDEILSAPSLPDRYSAQNAPFLGVPFTAKEAFGITGMPNTSGLLIRKGVVAEKDAGMVALLKEAGAIPIALTNCSELCMWYESSNLVYGRCNSAYHLGRIVGGSSGGEGCIVTAAGTAMGVGSDIGGSIRLPSFFNGIFGHKSTTGVVSNEGQFPLATGEALTFMTSGPMSRFAVDIMPMFKIMSKPAKDKLKLEEPVNVRTLKYYYMENIGARFLTNPVDPQITAALQKVVAHARDTLGAHVEKVHLNRMKYGFEMWTVKMSTGESIPFCTRMGDGKPVNPFWELLLWILQQPRHTLMAIVLGIGEKVPFPESDIVKFRSMCEQLKDDFRQLLGDDGVFLFPTFPVPAPYHNQPVLAPFDAVYTAVFNVLGLPVTHVPMGLNEEGVPIGIQVVGNFYNDHLTISVAEELEKAFGGWVAPFSA